MSRILALDYGLKRTGLAVTDPLQIIATPLETVLTADLLEFLKIYEKQEDIAEFVVGFPTNLNNEATDATQAVQEFVKTLEKTFPGKKISLEDERFTSKMALDSMIAAGSKKKDRREKGNIDKVSATIILQSYLDKKSSI